MPCRLINTISSIISIDLDNFSPMPSIDGKGSHGGYCGPAVKPIALNMVAEIARDRETAGLPISGIGGITNWRDAAEFIALSCGSVQVCTAAMTYGFKIVEEMVTGLSRWMDEKGYGTIEDFRSRAVGNVTDWQYLNLNYIAKAKIDQDLCIKCGRCYAACEDTSHQAIMQTKNGKRHFEVMDNECVACNLCVEVCPVEDCITMVQQTSGSDARTGRKINPGLCQLDHSPEQSHGPQGRRIVLDLAQGQPMLSQAHCLHALRRTCHGLQNNSRFAE